MKVFATMIPLALVVAGVARADVTELSGLASGSTVFSTYVVKNSRKTTPAKAMSDLKTLIAPLGLTPCLLGGDRGAAVVCSDGAVQISASHAYSYNFNNSFPGVITELRNLDPVLYKGARLPDGVGQTWAVNFLPPPTDGVTPCTGACNAVGPVQFNFSAPVKQFGVKIDTSDASLTTTLTTRVRITINGNSIEKDLAFGVNQIAVSDIDPVTGLQLDMSSVLIEPIAGTTMAFSMDKMGYSVAQ